MGMITRVRARLRFISLSQKIHDKDEKHNKTVSLMSVVLVMPYFMRYYSPFLITCLSLVYSLLIVPILLHNWPLNKLTQFLQTTEDVLKTSAGAITEKLMYYKNRVEDTFLEMKNLQIIFTQIIFFTLIDQLLCQTQKLTGLYSLMFFNVIAYCFSYIKQLLLKEDWSPYVKISKTTNVKHLAMTTVKVTLEFTKAVTFLITVVFTLLVFGLEQGLEHYKPTWTYLCITGCFYFLTEKTFAEHFPSILDKFGFEIFESLESLWAPVLIKSMICISSSFFLFPAIYYLKFKLVCVAFYLNIWLMYRALIKTEWAALKKERKLLEKYRYATWNEVKARDDVCAVCLQSMRFARVTPCGHIFHGDCLRRCMKERFSCPMCKQDL
uniref:RING-type domain-containing protein n=1 Tax=Strigamia maritima TaxID=126957 RepID=T1INZ9_STRMM